MYPFHRRTWSALATSSAGSLAAVGLRLPGLFPSVL